jgi:tRNA pseudouridine38-40 synthase
VISPFDYRYAWHLVGPLDVDAMRDAARLVEGRHDFAAFQAAGSDVTSTVREVLVSRIADCGLEPNESTFRNDSTFRKPHSAILVYEVTGTGFLRYMVRTIVGSLIEIGRRKQPPEWMATVLASRDRATAGPTAPAAGLFLVGVDYEEG